MQSERKVKLRRRKQIQNFGSTPQSALIHHTTNQSKLISIVFFLRLINKHFQKFNRSTIKISYSSMLNIKSKVFTCNRKMLPKPVNQSTRRANSINKTTCLFHGSCVLENILCIKTKRNQSKFICKRYTNHKRLFNIDRHKNNKKISIEY